MYDLTIFYNEYVKNKNVWKIENIFSDTELKNIYEKVNQKRNEFDENFVFHGDSSLEDISGIGPDPDLGRFRIGRIEITQEVFKKLNDLLKDKTNKNLKLSGISCVEYSNEYGDPNLPPHFDSCETDLIINFQLQSNTEWELGLNLEVYKLEDNSALIFNPNEIIHWRPFKKFKDQEFVKMIFFRFTDYKTDNSHLMLSQDDEIFSEVLKYRMSLCHNLQDCDCFCDDCKKAQKNIIDKIIEEYRTCPNIVQSEDRLFCYTWWRHDDCERIRELLYRITKNRLYTLPEIRPSVSTAIEEMINDPDTAEILRRLEDSGI